MSTMPIDSILLRQYRVDEFIAAGGMGTVFRVWDLKRNVPLAMKMLHADLAEDPSILKRFQREARALEKLAHPNIVPFYGLHQMQDFAFLVERFIDGPTLKQILRRREGKPLPVDEALVYLKALSSALGYAHNHGVVHCDVKPGNVMIDQGGSIYLTDFGVARHAESTTTTLGFAGTAAYMAPEQIRGEAVTAQTDVYALGVMLYEMLTGRRPFRGDERETEGKGMTAAERIRYAHMNLAPTDPRETRQDFPEALAGLVLKALAKNPKDRYQTTKAFFEAVCIAVHVSPDSVRGLAMMPEGLTAIALESGIVPDYQPPSKGVIEVVASPAWRLVRWVVGIIGLGIVAAIVLIRIVRPSIVLESDVTTSAISPTLAPTQAVSPATATMKIVVNPTPGAKAGDIRINSIDSAQVVFVPEGIFTMGLTASQVDDLRDACPECTLRNLDASQPAHEVWLDSFWIYKTEITNGMYAQCVEAGYCNPPFEWSSQTRSSYYGNTSYRNYPVVNVDWYAAREYCRWVGGRLPTEAEWEKAARGTDARLFPWGNQYPGSRHANLFPLVGDTVAVGSYPRGASPYGAFDIAGNVFEWVADWYSPNTYDGSSRRNPKGPSRGNDQRRCLRGGSWGWEGSYASTGYRDWWEIYEYGSGVGFRCVLDTAP
ncbi:MAG: SUMF1/EgtB/PvdO family nonheme iron enzyme [Anaerolineales bacterium]|nr:SUMF1/EgtB/PvdO family nonheme iron enzyme [Anaerolineales bacterium]